MSIQPATMADHWWWRPGWRPGRRFYTWHFTFQDAADVHRLAETYRQSLAGVQGLDLVPDRWLHLTMQGLGFVDEVPEKEARAVVEAATARVRAVPSFQLALHRPDITPEAIRWEASPSKPSADVRTAIRAAIADVRPQVPEAVDGFVPHVSIAYSNSQGPAAPVAEALARVDAESARARIDSVELIVLNRDQHMYEWERIASVSLG